MTLAAILAEDMELRDLLLDACIADDAEWVAEREGFHVVRGPNQWRRGVALVELQIVNRRIYQIRECMK